MIRRPGPSAVATAAIRHHRAASRRGDRAADVRSVRSADRSRSDAGEEISPAAGALPIVRSHRVATCAASQDNPAMPEPAPPRRFGGALAVGAGILLSRIAGLVREVVFAHYLGLAPAADAF